VNILIYGSSRREGMPASLASGFRDLGHTVEVFDFTTFTYYGKIGTRWAHALDIALSKDVAYRINRSLRRRIESENFDIILFSEDLHVWPDTLACAAAMCPWVVIWHFDEPFNPRYVRPLTLERFKSYEVVFTPRSHLTAEYQTRGAKRVCYLPFCIDPAVHYPATPSREEQKTMGAAVTFAGSWSRRRERLVGSLSGIDVRVWGHGWRHASRQTRAIRGLKLMSNPVIGRNMSLALNASKIAINFLTLDQRDRVNVRNLEIPACGAFQLCERSQALLSLFREGLEVACFSSSEELLDKVHYYLRHDSEREAIARAANARLIQSESTYKDRALAILVERAKF
jgi:spore maturation protein CgeB